MKRRSLEEYQRERREQAPHTTPGDDERKEAVLEHGRGCLRRIKGDTTWEDWLGIGAALMVITEEALVEVSVAVWNPDNKKLVRAFNRRWEEYEASAAEVGSNQKPLSKQERWAVREVMTNPDIGAWRATLDGVNRRKLNHPNRVIDRWKGATQTRDREPKKPSPSISQALKERGKVIAEQEERIKELTEEVEGRTAAPQTLDELFAAVATLLQGEALDTIKAALGRLHEMVRVAKIEHLKKHGPTEKDLPKRGRRKGSSGRPHPAPGAPPRRAHRGG
jgi:hypothetical protein